MRLPLRLHPDGSSPAERVEVEIERPRPLDLALTWVVTGDIERLRIPPPATVRRRDGLWQHSCFETFLQRPSEESYYELNLAPSGEWAAYSFTGYRRDMAKAEMAAPCIAVRQSLRELRAEAAVRLPKAWAESSWHLAVSAVLEDVDGTISYWALAHPPGRPDFHHQDCFVAELPPPERA